ncbi:MAG: cytochrome c oxidase accessory protein CcoG [Rubripirellula sp.]
MNESQPNTDSQSGGGSTLLNAPEHVLSTLESDGSRRWLFPRLSKGSLWKRRRALAYFLIVFFVALPHLRINGKPVILLDILSRKFVFFGHTFLPTDTLLLTLLMLAGFVMIVYATAVAGRIWCGWACPQTVYMEFLFRPIDRFFEGTSGKGGKPKQKPTGLMAIARYLIYLVLCMLLAHTFLAYFVGTEALARWVRSSPLEHPTAFLVMGGTTGLMLFDFLFFREQLCLIACPYGRFQSVMLDRQSLIVAYDPTRGEPRRKGRRHEDDVEKAGDCVDCNQCVVVCPTGIDIRNGLQLECVNCTQCIDACNNVMDRVGTPQGLIRYSSQDALDGKPPRFLRMRTIAYPLALAIVGIVFVGVLMTKFAFDASLMRGQGNPYQRVGGGMINNNFNLRLTNRTDEPRTYTIKVLEPVEASVSSATNDIVELKGNGSQRFPVVVEIKATYIGAAGQCQGKLIVEDDIGNERVVAMKLVGPR